MAIVGMPAMRDPDILEMLDEEGKSEGFLGNPWLKGKLHDDDNEETFDDHQQWLIDSFKNL